MGTNPDTPSRPCRAKPIADAVWHNGYLLRHQILNNRALLRKRKLHPNLRARLTELQPRLEARAVELGINHRGWRAYPARDAGGLVFGVTVDQDGYSHTPPATVANRRKDHRPATQAGAEMLAAVEQQVASAVT